MSKKIALVGCGEWGKYLLRDLKELNCHVTAVCVSEKSQKNAQLGQADLIVSSVEEIGQVDGAVIATPTSTHAAVIKEVMKKNIPVFVEKPMTCRVQDAKELVKAYGDRLYVMDKWRYHDGIIKLVDIVQNQELGKLKGIKLTRVSSHNPHPDVDIIWTCLPHDLTITYELLGYIPEPKHAVANEIKGETFSLMALLGEDPWVTISVASNYPYKKREVLLEFEQGAVLLEDGNADILKMYRHSSSIENRSFSTEFPTLVELRAFIHYLSGGPPPKSSAKEGLLIVEFIQKIRDIAKIQSGLLQSGLLQ